MIKRVFLGLAVALCSLTGVAHAELIVANATDLKFEQPVEKTSRFMAKRGEKMSDVFKKWADIGGLSVSYETTFDPQLTQDVNANDLADAVVALAVQLMHMDKGAVVNMNHPGKLIVQDYVKQ